MCSSLSVACRGSRMPCSQLSTAFELTLSSRANRAWLAFRPSRRARMSEGFIGLGRPGSSALRKSRPPFVGFAACLCDSFFLSFFLSFFPMPHLDCHNVVLPQCRISHPPRKWHQSASPSHPASQPPFGLDPVLSAPLW